MDARKYQEVEFTSIECHPRYYKLMRVNKQTNRVSQLMICKYRDCHYRFTKLTNLIDHLNCHDKIKPYKCKECSKAFV